MKKSITLLILVACLILQESGAQETGITDDCGNEAKTFEARCHRYQCNGETGHYTVETCAIPSINCQPGKVFQEIPEDLNKPYPNCCAQYLCRDP